MEEGCTDKYSICRTEKIQS